MEQQSCVLPASRVQRLASLCGVSIEFAHVASIGSTGATSAVSSRTFRQEFQPDQATAAIRHESVAVNCPHCAKTFGVRVHISRFIVVTSDELAAPESAQFRQAVFSSKLARGRKTCLLLYFPLCLFASWVVLNFAIMVFGGGLSEESAEAGPQADPPMIESSLLATGFAATVVGAGYCVWRGKLRHRLWNLTKPLLCQDSEAPMEFRPGFPLEVVTMVRIKSNWVFLPPFVSPGDHRILGEEVSEPNQWGRRLTTVGHAGFSRRARAVLGDIEDLT